MNKSIRYLDARTKKGDIASAYQLYQYYKDGKYVEKDINHSLHYFEVYLSLLKKTKICLTKVELNDFRKIRNLPLSIDNQLTVLVGNNGAGKTSIIEGIVKCLSWFNAEIERAGSNGKKIAHSDINIHSEEYAEINMEFQLNSSNKFHMSLVQPVEGLAAKKDSNLDDLRVLASLYRVASSVENISLPLMAYYSVDRSSIKGITKGGIEDIGGTDRALSRFDAYKNALDGRCDYFDFAKWYLELDNIANNRPTGENENLRNEILVLESIIKKIHGNIPKDTDDPYVAALLEKQKKLNNLKEFSEHDIHHKLATIKKAMTALVPGLTDFYIDRATGKADIIFEIQGEKVNASQVSKGQQTVIALVADLTKRLLTLNPHLKNPLESDGIVIIDEIELHLHPSWQQIILTTLGNIFPNIQLIVSTHSPQVLTTVKPHSIRGLKIEENVITVKDNYQFSEGAEAQFVLEDILGVGARPANIDIVKKLNHYMALVSEDKWDEEEAITLRKELDDWGGEHEPLLLRLDMDIRMRKFRRQ